MTSKYMLLLPCKSTTLPFDLVEVKYLPTSSPNGPYCPPLVWNLSDFMIVGYSLAVIEP